MLCLDRLEYQNIKLGQRDEKSEQSLVVNHVGLVGSSAGSLGGLQFSGTSEQSGVGIKKRSGRRDRKSSIAH